MKTIVLALGGNAITRAMETGTWEQQIANIQVVCRHMAELVKQGNRILIIHGNGPQVGNILLQNESAKAIVPAMPLDVCVAKTQGMLGYAICRTLGNYLLELKITQPVVTVMTQVVVAADDPSFNNPTKFVGPFFTEQEAQVVAKTKGHIMREDSGRGWRRVVPSPEPLAIVEKDIINQLLSSGAIVVAGGGGGIPVIQTSSGLDGVEAVIDKDMAGQLLADAVNADAFLLLTEVERVSINFGTPQQQQLQSMTIDQAKQYQREGHFPPGSMGPKVEAAIRFAASGDGRKAYIVSLANAAKAFDGNSGTVITNG